jgi:hypothetical protein
MSGRIANLVPVAPLRGDSIAKQHPLWGKFRMKTEIGSGQIKKWAVAPGQHGFAHLQKSVFCSQSKGYSPENLDGDTDG